MERQLKSVLSQEVEKNFNENMVVIFKKSNKLFYFKSKLLNLNIFLMERIKMQFSVYQKYKF